MFRISRLGWIWVGCSAVLAVIEYLRSEIAIVADGALFSMGLIWCVILLGMILSMRHSPLRAFALPPECLAQLIAVSVICSFLQYPAAKIARPLIDAELAPIDRALYFDWPAYFAWVLRHPLALNLLSGVYLPAWCTKRSHVFGVAPARSGEHMALSQRAESRMLPPSSSWLPDPDR
jgi:hypothetical protein